MKYPEVGERVQLVEESIWWKCPLVDESVGGRVHLVEESIWWKSPLVDESVGG